MAGHEAVIHVQRDRQIPHLTCPFSNAGPMYWSTFSLVTTGWGNSIAERDSRAA
jgi:hypothetical protein